MSAMSLSDLRPAGSQPAYPMILDVTAGEGRNTNMTTTKTVKYAG
jgi:hypothetical protein